ncbi:MAG: metallophosphoesterase [Candidatus Bathyarchaeia archaeon]
MLTFIEPHPALLLRHEKQRTLIVSDLHIGWEVALSEKGVHVPSQMPKLLEKLVQIIKQTKPSMLLLLGDVKHTIAKAATEEWRDIPDFFETLTKTVPAIKIILGNHDGNLEPLLPEKIEILPPTGTTIGDVGFFHGHTWPAVELLKCRTMVMGHVHPMIMFQDPSGFRITRQVWVRAKCNGEQLKKSLVRHYNIKQTTTLKVKTTQFIIMPSFNEFLGGQPVNRKGIGTDHKYQAFIGPVLRSKSVKIADAELFLLDGTFLGTVEQLTALSLS